MRKNRFLRVLAVCCLVVLNFPAGPLNAESYRVSARSAIFSDSTRVVRLYGKNVHTRVLPASTTKVMTALVVLEKLPLNRYVTVSERATRVQPTKLNLKAGEQYKVRDLLYAILINSANDASVVLAEAVSGSEWRFVNLMNERARQLGAKQTKFANSNGLPSKESQYTTAYDMYLIFRQAVKSQFFKKAIEQKYYTIYSKDGRKISFKSHNKMLFWDWGKNIHGKTGYTRGAKACFVGYLKGEKTLKIIVVFGCTRRWDDIRHLVSNYGKR
jgi:D-alanyl-D-alanine carboxypeptidase